jgi:hypothetical protein
MNSNWNRQTPVERAKAVQGMFDLAARGQALKASRELDRAVEKGNPEAIEEALAVARAAVVAVLS